MNSNTNESMEQATAYSTELRDLFIKAVPKAETIADEAEFHNGTGYFNGLAERRFVRPVTFIDDKGRRVLAVTNTAQTATLVLFVRGEGSGYLHYNYETDNGYNSGGNTRVDYEFLEGIEAIELLRNAAA